MKWIAFVFIFNDIHDTTYYNLLVKWNKIEKMELIKRENGKKNSTKVTTELIKIWNRKFVSLHFVLIHIAHYLPFLLINK